MRAPQQRTMRDLYDRTHHEDLAAPEVRRAATPRLRVVVPVVVEFPQRMRWGIVLIRLGVFACLRVLIRFRLY
jgi:hypothetical protein